MVLAVRHNCVCGHAFLICVAGDDDERPEDWPELVRSAAARIGASYLQADGNVRFKCPRCESVLLLLTPRAQNYDVVYPDLRVQPYARTLN